MVGQEVFHRHRGGNGVFSHGDTSCTSKACTEQCRSVVLCYLLSGTGVLDFASSVLIASAQGSSSKIAIT
jgi:hypothetical protein